MNEEQENGLCADFAVRYCCPKYTTGVMDCEKEGYKWSKWLNSDNPTGNGDFEYISTFTANNGLWARLNRKSIHLVPFSLSLERM